MYCILSCTWVIVGSDEDYMCLTVNYHYRPQTNIIKGYLYTFYNMYLLDFMGVIY